MWGRRWGVSPVTPDPAARSSPDQAAGGGPTPQFTPAAYAFSMAVTALVIISSVVAGVLLAGAALILITECERFDKRLEAY